MQINFSKNDWAIFVASLNDVLTVQNTENYFQSCLNPVEEDFLSNGPFIIRGLWRFRISSFSKSRVAFWKCSDFRLKNDRSLPERFEVPRNFFQIQRLLSILAVFSSMTLFFGISVIVPPIFHSFWMNQILKVTEDNSFRPFFLFEICFPKFVPSSKIQLTRHLTRRTIKSSYRYRLMMF